MQARLRRLACGLVEGRNSKMTEPFRQATPDSAYLLSGPLVSRPGVRWGVSATEKTRHPGRGIRRAHRTRIRRASVDKRTFERADARSTFAQSFADVTRNCREKEIRRTRAGDQLQDTRDRAVANSARERWRKCRCRPRLWCAPGGGRSLALHTPGSGLSRVRKNPESAPERLEGLQV